jgi:hypothetical protein
MQMKNIPFCAVAVSFWWLNPVSISAQIWTQTTAPSQQGWQSIATSADGNRVIASGGGYGDSTYVSTNGGATWTPSLADTGLVVSSTNGSNFALVEINFGNGIRTSSDGGLTWQSITPPEATWSALACSADGLKLVGCSTADPVALTGPIWRSTDFGATWTVTGAQSNDWYWSSIVSSADGTKLIAACNDDTNQSGAGGPIFYSLDSGATWTQSDAPTNYLWNYLAGSADGTRLIAVASGLGSSPTPIYLSTDSGAHWSPSGDFSVNWDCAGCSGDGSKLVALGHLSSPYLLLYSEVIYCSTNGGTNWTWTTAPVSDFRSVASSADGSRRFLAGQRIYTEAAASAWRQTGAVPTNFWLAVSASADGSKLLASSQYMYDLSDRSAVYRSTNSGASWLLTSLPDGFFVSLSSSADGNNLLAVSPAWVYTSRDAGATWTSNSMPSTAYNWLHGASSDNGSSLVVVANGFGTAGPVFISTNAGASWAQCGSAPLAYWSGIACSADGSKLVATDNHLPGAYGIYYPSYIHASTNSGASWFVTGAPQLYWSAVASSADGGKWFAAAGGGSYAYPMGIYTSTNFGASWTTNNTPLESWSAISCSADGTRVVAIAPGNVMYYSTDSGTTWTSGGTPLQNWVAAAFSGNGNLLLGASYYGGIYALALPVAAPLPSLQIALANSRASIAWPTNNAAGFILQQTTNLLGTNWVTVTNLPVITNLFYQVSLTPTNRQDFFRLKGTSP